MESPLRLLAWRAIWPMLQYNPVMAARYQAMTRAAGAPAADTGPRQGTAAQAAARARRAKARVACPAWLLRWIYCMAVHDTSWDPAVASGAASWHDAPAHPNGGRLTSALPGSLDIPFLTLVRR